MGTRGTIHIKDGKKHLASVYRQMDSYPTGLGSEIFDLLKFSEIVNGYTGSHSAPEQFNGMGCLAAYLIGHLKLVPYGQIKNAIGNIYLTDKTDRQEFNYFISQKDSKVFLKVTDYDDEEIFSGPIIEFNDEKRKALK